MKRKLINVGIAIVVPAQRIIQVLEMFTNDDADQAALSSKKARTRDKPSWRPIQENVPRSFL
jgi:hypothetical protein